MNPFKYYLYLSILTIIRIYKWAEYQLLKSLTPWLKKKGKDYAESFGVILHCPGDPKWTEEDSKRVLAKLKKYNDLVHLKVNSLSFFPRIANLCGLANGEMFMEGLWECTKDEADVVNWVQRIFENDSFLFYYNKLNRFLQWLELEAFNLHTAKMTNLVAEHYDLGNDLYQLMLDPWMQYSCGYWAKADNLNKAQEDKLELIAKKLDLKPGMRVLDIGCGFGTLCKYLAQNYGVQCVGVTISKEQAEFGRRGNEGLDVEIRLQDYREVDEVFDRVVSVGTFEHIGWKNYREFMEVANRCLKDDGIFLLHTIAYDHIMDVPRSEPWLHKYIFPNGQLPLPTDITRHIKCLFILEDWHNFGPDYAKTLAAWRNNFKLGWSKIKVKYGPKFYKMWIYYLCYCEAVFLSRHVQLYQVLLSKSGLQSGHRAPR